MSSERQSETKHTRKIAASFRGKLSSLFHPSQIETDSSSDNLTTPLPSHKRKRSLQDSTVDLSKMRMALNRLEALKEELDGIEETEDELCIVLKHITAVEDTLKGAKKETSLSHFICYLLLLMMPSE